MVRRKVLKLLVHLRGSPRDWRRLGSGRDEKLLEIPMDCEKVVKKLDQ